MTKSIIIQSASESDFAQTRFCNWAKSFIRKALFESKQFSRQCWIRSMVEVSREFPTPISQQDMSNLWRYYYDTQEGKNLDLDHEMLRPFLQALRQIFCLSPDTLQTGEVDPRARHKIGQRQPKLSLGVVSNQANKPKPAPRSPFTSTNAVNMALLTKRSKKKEDKRFRKWANDYLINFFTEVIYRSTGDMSSINLRLWVELQDAAHAVFSEEQFKDFNKYRHLPKNKVDIAHGLLADFIPPLQYIYANSGVKRRLEMNDSTTKTYDNLAALLQDTPSAVTKTSTKKRVVSDLETSPTEEINIRACPVELPSKIEQPDFEDRVIRLLTLALRDRRMSWLSGNAIANCLGVDPREFEEWALKSSRLVNRPAYMRADITFFSLPPAVYYSNREVPKMSATDTETPVKTDDEAKTETEGDLIPLGEAAKETKEPLAPPVIGSQPFDTLVTQFLSTGDLWRTSNAIAKVTGHDAIAIEAWADQCLSLIRRPSKEQGKVYFALSSRLVEKKDEEPATVVTKTKTPVAPATTQVAADSPLITQKEILAFGMLANLQDSLYRVMSFYANTLAIGHEEAASHFTKAQKHLTSGVSLLQKSLKIKANKLPEVEG